MTEPTQPAYPVYEKDGRTQIAATVGDEVRLKFAGWRKQEPPTPPAAAGSGADSDPAAKQTKRPPKSDTE
ncbi:hypothetical protein NE236_41330 [Actinoallomurus purpureus]|uniref:hypothetical protein n=1 Tax=Actinoallomurus purpureus TaxID=478114 RepID=UPI002092D8E8|nr:hypothetical protein [Actinoallomurus purpureus]MCO6011412.1 hypothetical protein [Actinoallomurus purpureus]